jgi:amino acid permease
MAEKELKHVDVDNVDPLDHSHHAQESGKDGSLKVTNEDAQYVEIEPGDLSDNVDLLQRRLNNRQIQLIAIGGSIGTAIFVSKRKIM